MAEQPRNGYDPTRLDRIEGLLPILADMHRQFDEDYEKLLVALAALTVRIGNIRIPPSH
jgi:hypothetical protein